MALCSDGPSLNTFAQLLVVVDDANRDNCAFFQPQRHAGLPDWLPPPRLVPKYIYTTPRNVASVPVQLLLL